MDPITASVSALHATYQVLLFSVDVDQVPSQVRRSLELVQTCHRDLQHLIEIRNECLPLLEKTPIVLTRVNDIIHTANQGLVEVCQIVEKCRPGANNGKVPFKNRVGWVLFDSREFRAQEPVISRHHAAVLSELNFLRQIALLAPMSLQQATPKTEEIKPQKTEIFDNVALLGGLMGEMAISGKNPSTSSLSAEPVSLKSTSSTNPKFIKPFYPHPSQGPTYAMTSKSVKLTPAPHDTFCELEAPFDASFRSSTPRLNHPSQPVFQAPIPDRAPAKFEITAPPSSPSTGRLSLWHGNQTQETLVEPPSPSSTPGIVASDKLSDLEPVQHLRSSPSTPSSNSIDQSSNPPRLSDQPSDPNMLQENSHKDRYSRFSGYFRRTKEPRHETYPLQSAATQNNLRHAKSYGDMSLARSGTQSTVTGKWFSPDSVYALASPASSHATLENETPALGPSPACTPFDSTVSLNTIFTVSSDATSNHDTSHERTRSRDKTTYINVQPPTPVQPRPNSIGPLGAQHSHVSTGTTKSVVLQPQSKSTSSTIIFESAFWGLGGSQDYMNFDVPQKSPRTHAQGELGRSRTEGMLSTAPQELGTKHVRHASSHADLTYHKTTPGVNRPQELSAVPSVRVAELP